LAFLEGNWQSALNHYAECYWLANSGDFNQEMASVCVNRGYIYALQGQYGLARSQCNEALEILNGLPDTDDNLRRKIYAWMNLGTAYRHSEDFDNADTCYRESVTIARECNNQEALCAVYQHLGSSRHLQGRRVRRDPTSEAKEIAWACLQQAEAWRYLTDSLQIAWQSNLENAIADGLGRLARVYREIFHLEHLPSKILSSPEVIRELEHLKGLCNSYEMVFELKYENELIFPGVFHSLNWQERAARLFDVSALAAEEVNDFHRALESLTELSRTLLWLGMLDRVVLLIKRIERIKGYDYQEPLFAAEVEILRGDLAIHQGREEEALEKYRTAYVALAKASGYATYELNNRLRDLEWRIREDVPPERRVGWCDMLEDSWMEAGFSLSYPIMIHRIERLRKELRSQENR
jgi:hypothetical protein